MNAPTERCVKKLFALSLNQCAFPDCISPIFTLSDDMVGEICHIKARSKGGPRYDEGQTDDDRHGFENLLLLCRNHHKVIDDAPEKYPVEWLKQIKAEHEKSGSIELSQHDAQLAQRLLDAYLEISAKDSQILTNSPNSKQTKKKSRKSVKQTVIGDGNIVTGGNLIHTEKVVQKNVTQPGPQHITEEQAYEVKRLIDELAQIDVDTGRPDSHKGWYSWLYRKFKVTSYKTIPSEKYDQVISSLKQQKAINRKKLRRTNNEEWTIQICGAIHGRWRQLGNERQPFTTLPIKDYSWINR